MWALGVIAGLIVATAIALYFLGRDNVEPMERHLRALDALRDLSEHPRPGIVDVAPPPDIPTDHVRILAEAPVGARSTRRASPKRSAARTARARPNGRRTVKPRTGATAARNDLPTIEIRPVPTRNLQVPEGPIAKVEAPQFAPGSWAALHLSPSEPGDEPASELDLEPEPMPTFGAPEPAVGAPPHTLEPFRDPVTATQWIGTRSRAARDQLSAIPARVYAVAGSALFVVLLAIVVTTAALGGRGGPSASAAKPPVSPATQPAVASSTTAPPVTAPARIAPVVARSNTGATISVASPFQLTLQASGTCWVEVTDSSGRAMFMTTLHAGQRQQIPATGPIVVRLGYTPAVSISVDGTTLDLSGLSQTANLNFQSA